MAIVPGHRRADDLITVNRHEKKLPLHRDLGWNYDLRRAPACEVQVCFAPQRFHTVEIPILISDDVKLHSAFRPHDHCSKSKRPAEISTGHEFCRLPVI